MILGVDYSFLKAKEGRELKGYVPRNKKGEIIGKSGVTVGTGVDLGQRTSDQILHLDIPSELRRKLLPYAGKRREEALNYLRDHPLTLTEAEVDALDRAVQDQDFKILIFIFDSESKTKFSEIPNAAKTVLCSLALNFGPNLRKALPLTWRAIAANDWRRLAIILDNFPSKQPELDKRRKSEAALLRTI